MTNTHHCAQVEIVKMRKRNFTSEKVVNEDKTLVNEAMMNPSQQIYGGEVLTQNPGK